MEEDKAISIFKKHYKEWENNPLRMESGYDYEKTYAEMMQKVEQEVLQISVGKIPKSKNSKKKSKPVLGK
jgi:hypothetical protein